MTKYSPKIRRNTFNRGQLLDVSQSNFVLHDSNFLIKWFYDATWKEMYATVRNICDGCKFVNENVPLVSAGEAGLASSNSNDVLFEWGKEAWGGAPGPALGKETDIKNYKHEH